MRFLRSSSLLCPVLRVLLELLLMSVVDTELKARIQAFKAEKKGKKIADAGVMDEVMDTAAG